jgi:hypothetical protein
MEFIAEIVLQFLGELLLQLFVQLITEFGFRSLADTFQRRKHPVWSIIGFTLWGAAIGGLSLLLFPHSFIHNAMFRQMNLFVTPVAAGGMMWLIGRIRLKHGQDIQNLDRFGYAFTFAFAMAFVRFHWAT